MGHTPPMPLHRIAGRGGRAKGGIGCASGGVGWASEGGGRATRRGASVMRWVGWPFGQGLRTAATGGSAVEKLGQVSAA